LEVQRPIQETQTDYGPRFQLLFITELMHIIYESFGKFCLYILFKANVSLVDKVLLLTPLTSTKVHHS